jgi:3D-(3,5/4)-trihydroxycyclohexane-1,2-dione acylhydrolase (decyclizing)
MMNSEIATSVALGLKLIIVLLDNRGFGCINRLQQATGSAPFNNLLDAAMPAVDFVKHAESLGAIGVKAESLKALEENLQIAKTNDRTTVIVIDTDPAISTGDGGHWWDVAVPEASNSSAVRAAHAAYVKAKTQQQLG